MEYKGIKEGDWVEAVQTKRRFTNPCPWGDESWVDHFVCGKVVLDQPKKNCPACHGWGSLPVHSDPREMRPPCKPCGGKGLVKDEAAPVRLVLVDAQTFVADGKTKVFETPRPLDSFASLRKIKEEDAKPKPFEAYEFDKGGKRVKVGTKRTAWILAQRKLEAGNKRAADGSPLWGDWRSHITLESLPGDIGTVLDPIRDAREIDAIKKRVSRK